MKVSEARHAGTNLPLLAKRVWETLVFEVNFEARLDAGETIEAVDSVEATSLADSPGATGLTITDAAERPDGEGTRVVFQAGEGTAGEAYKVRLRVVVNDDVRLEDEIVVEVV